MNPCQKPLVALIGIIGFLASCYGEEVVVPVAEAAPALAAPAVIPDTANVVAPNAPVATAPVATPPLVARPYPAGGVVPTGEAVTTEHRAPDGSVITVTKYNGQLPHNAFQPAFPGFWSPYGLQYGGIRPYYHYPL